MEIFIQERAGALVIYIFCVYSVVFGMTDVKSRICLISTARHDPDFPTNPFIEN
jgi:hypothetical protein